MESLTNLSSSVTTTHCHRETWQIDPNNALQKSCLLQPTNLNGREHYKLCNCSDPKTCTLYQKDLADLDM